MPQPCPIVHQEPHNSGRRSDRAHSMDEEDKAQREAGAEPRSHSKKAGTLETRGTASVLPGQPHLTMPTLENLPAPQDSQGPHGELLCPLC